MPVDGAMFLLWFAVAIGTVVFVVRLVSRPHKHRSSNWSGMTEQCRCGAWASDRRDPSTNRRLSNFHQWEDLDR